MECDASVTAFRLIIMYTEDGRRKKAGGNGKEYTISELVHHLGCDRETRTKNST
jgi:hypothetical protein